MKLSISNLKFVILAACTISVLPSAYAYGPNYQAEVYYACTHNPGSSVRLRQGPGQQFRIKGGIPSGTPVKVINSVQGSDGFSWMLVQWKRTVGWSRSDYICNS